MTIDKAKLKALAEAMLRDEQGAELSGEEVRGFPEAVRSYEAMTAPSAVLALLAEIERLEREADQAKADGADAFGLAQGRADTIDQLKAENEALRKSAGLAAILPQLDEALEDLELHGRHTDQGYRKLKDWYRKVKLACDSIDAAMAKETSHG
ncbi:hypothetical protein [Pseudomonas putida]|uniref:hypothetical protein n=1 Tax=Pseudomonas putida TaxID=303 RepID=UPI0035A48CD7